MVGNDKYHEHSLLSKIRRKLILNVKITVRICVIIVIVYFLIIVTQFDLLQQNYFHDGTVVDYYHGDGYVVFLCRDESGSNIKIILLKKILPGIYGAIPEYDGDYSSSCYECVSLELSNKLKNKNTGRIFIEYGISHNVSSAEVYYGNGLGLELYYTDGIAFRVKDADNDPYYSFCDRYVVNEVIFKDKKEQIVGKIRY